MVLFDGLDVKAPEKETIALLSSRITLAVFNLLIFIFIYCAKMVLFDSLDRKGAKKIKYLFTYIRLTNIKGEIPGVSNLIWRYCDIGGMG